VEQRPEVHKYSQAVKFITHVPALAFLALSLWSPVASADAQASERSVLRQLYGDLAFEVRTKGQGSLMVGVADARTSLVLTLMAIDLRRWSDSATRVLAAKAPARGRSAKWEAVVAGPGVTAGSMALARSIGPGDTSITLLVTDTTFRGVRTSLTMEEARALASAMKRAAMASLPTKVPPMKQAPPATKPPPKKPPPSKGPSRH
jgi:hypothetical protein